MSGTRDIDATIATRPDGLVRVAQVTALFWITKVLTTGMGETLSDYLVHRISPIVAGFCGAVVFAVALALQLSRRRYVVGVYWFAVAMVSVFGTMAADGLHIELHVPYLASTIFYAAALSAIFGLWYLTERDLSIHTITTTRRELFYWATVLATFALGTAVGDFTANTLRLGYFSSGLLFAGLIAIPALAFWRFRRGPVLCFWSAYVLTRPLGASFADWIGVSHERGGLGVGTLEISLVLAGAIAVCVGLIAITGG
jgi:uncharacterized membrane-anchored protein